MRERGREGHGCSGGYRSGSPCRVGTDGGDETGEDGSALGDELQRAEHPARRPSARRFGGEQRQADEAERHPGAEHQPCGGEGRQRSGDVVPRESGGDQREAEDHARARPGAQRAVRGRREQQVAQVRQGEEAPGDGAGDPGDALLHQFDEVRIGDHGREDERELQGVEGQQLRPRYRRSVVHGVVPGRRPLCLGQQREQPGGGERQHGEQRVLAVWREPRRERADDDGRGDQRRPCAALHEGERPGQALAGEGRSQIPVGRGEGTAEQPLEHERRGEGGEAVRGAGEQEGEGQPELGAQQEPFAAEPVGEASPQRRAEGGEDRGDDIEQPGPVCVRVAELGQDHREIGRQAEGREGRDEVARGHDMHLTAAEPGGGPGADQGAGTELRERLHDAPPGRR